ncbi:MAG TPA: hypothetical protein VM282_27815 [Acidimicrobiales bacterium]|nr:hypothetical protein [Acidimicrobiales bacterium]
MTPDQALRLLGLDETSTWADVRHAYRTKIRSAHPDAGGSFEPAASLNSAMAVLARKFAPNDVPHRTADVTFRITSTAEDDGLVLVAPTDEVFDRLWRALGAVADVVVVDVSAGVLVGDLYRDLGAGRLVVEVRPPVDPTQPCTVEFTLDQLGALPAPNIDDVVRELARLVRAP